MTIQYASVAIAYRRLGSSSMRGKVSRSIEKVSRSGIVTADGTERPFDAVICATGYQPFEKDALPTYPVHGKGGIGLADYWDQNRYQAFRGYAVTGFPNYFMIFGPYAISSTSYIVMIELQVRNIIGALNAADLVTVTDEGIWLRRCCDIEVGGCRLVPVGRDRVGRRWQLVPGGDGSPIVTPP